MLLKLALLLSAVCAISAETVEIECSVATIDLVEYCYVDKLPEELPANATWKFLCPQDCFRVRMENVNLPRFPRELWNTHKQVTYLALYNTDIEELAYGDFFNAEKLDVILLNYNKKLTSLRDNCFSGASELDSINLYFNKISELEVNAFDSIPLVTELDLQNNEISHITHEHFRTLPNLQFLNLFQNTINTIDQQAFLHNPKLEYLNINWNNLNEVVLLLPVFIPGTITIYGNQLTTVAIRSISTLPINESVTGASFTLHSNKLTELYIQDNIAVDTLILYENPIERIDTLPVLRSLKELNLERCEIKSLDEQRFVDKFVNLKKLYLTGNHITSFSKETFAGLDKLDTLTLDVNGLTEVDFPRLESLTTLDVKNNRLTEFRYGDDVRGTFPALRTLDIRNNNFDEKYLAELVKAFEDQGITVRG